MGLPHPDRRRNRSDDPLTALLLFLEAARKGGQMEALALADDGGVLVAGAGCSQACETMAALAPFFAHGFAANDTIPTRLEVMATTHIRRIRVDGIELLLCARERGKGVEASLGSLSEGIRRILSTDRPRGAKPHL
jgi:hypothetical protein